MAAQKNQSSSGLVIKQQNADDRLVVEAYGEGGFRFLGRRFSGAVLVLPSGVYPVPAASVEDFAFENLSQALEGADKPELLLVGTGERMQLLPKDFQQELKEQSIGFDTMDTGAAARTYNVLLLEGRRVAALLLPVT